MANLDLLYMSFAENMASISKGKRLQVGAVLVTSNGVVLTGVNGLPTELGNTLENFDPKGGLTTKPNVIHSELNCLLKAAREGVSVVGSTLYVTHSPCLACASMLIAAGVKRVVYRHNYRDLSGLADLKIANIIVDKIGGADVSQATTESNIYS